MVGMEMNRDYQEKEIMMQMEVHRKKEGMEDEKEAIVSIDDDGDEQSKRALSVEMRQIGNAKVIVLCWRDIAQKSVKRGIGWLINGYANERCR